MKKPRKRVKNKAKMVALFCKAYNEAINVAQETLVKEHYTTTAGGALAEEY